MNRANQPRPNQLDISFISGILSTTGSFLVAKAKGRRFPYFQIKVRGDQKEILERVRFGLGLKEVIYEYNHQKRHYAQLNIRNISIISNILLPILSNCMFGERGKHFLNWKKEVVNKYIHQIVSRETIL